MLGLQSTADQQSFTVVYFLYGGLLLYFLYKIYKNQKALKLAEGEKHYFGRTVSNWLYYVGVLVVIFGAVNIYQGMYLIGGFMIALILVLIVETKAKTVVAENGISAGDKFVLWNDIKKWGFDRERSELIISYKEGFEHKNAYLKIKLSDVDEINELFRKFKLKK